MLTIFSAKPLGMTAVAINVSCLINELYVANNLGAAVKAIKALKTLPGGKRWLCHLATMADLPLNAAAAGVDSAKVMVQIQIIGKLEAYRSKVTKRQYLSIDGYQIPVTKPLEIVSLLSYCNMIFAPFYQRLVSSCIKKDATQSPYVLPCIELACYLVGDGYLPVFKLLLDMLVYVNILKKPEQKLLKEVYQHFSMKIDELDRMTANREDRDDIEHLRQEVAVAMSKLSPSLRSYFMDEQVVPVLSVFWRSTSVPKAVPIVDGSFKSVGGAATHTIHGASQSYASLRSVS